MPSDGLVNCKQKYIDQWMELAGEDNAKFVIIDNLSKKPQKEIKKLMESNILIISGGNTFKLLYNLRKSGLDKAITHFANKGEFVLSGYSAGAFVLTPTIKICNLSKFSNNDIGLTDLTGLNIVDFEVFPHYNKQNDKLSLKEYCNMATNEVKEISETGFIKLDLES